LPPPRPKLFADYRWRPIPTPAAGDEKRPPGSPQPAPQALIQGGARLPHRGRLPPPRANSHGGTDSVPGASIPPLNVPHRAGLHPPQHDVNFLNLLAEALTTPKWCDKCFPVAHARGPWHCTPHQPPVVRALSACWIAPGKHAVLLPAVALGVSSSARTRCLSSILLPFPAQLTAKR